MDRFGEQLVNRILEDRHGHIWFGTSTDGVFRFDGDFFWHYSTNQGLNNVTVITLTEDDQGVIWAGTRTGGLNRFIPNEKGGRFGNYITEGQGLTANTILTTITDNQGNLWVGTEGGGVCKFVPKVLKAGP